MTHLHSSARRFALAAVLTATLTLPSCIGFDGMVGAGDSYWSVDDYIGAPGYWGPGFYGNGWGAPAPPPPAFGPSYTPPPQRPVRPPQNNNNGWRPQGPGSTPEGVTPPGGGNHVTVPSGSTSPSFPTNPSGGTRPGNNGRPR